MCQEVRNYILEHIDWECEVKVRFQDKNLGCKTAVSSAIDWFFFRSRRGDHSNVKFKMKSKILADYELLK